MNTMRTMGITTAVAAALLMPAVAAGPAFAQGGGAVKAAGACTAGGTWKLKAKADDPAILEVEFEVDTNVVGQVWRVTITDGPTTVFAGRRTTVAPSGSFTVAATTPDRAGRDTVKAVATRGANTCTGTVRI